MSTLFVPCGHTGSFLVSPRVPRSLANFSSAYLDNALRPTLLVVSDLIRQLLTELV